MSKKTGKTGDAGSQRDAAALKRAFSKDWDRVMRDIEVDPYIVAILSWALNKSYREGFPLEDLKKFLRDTPKEEIRKYYSVEDSHYSPAYGYGGGVPDRLITAFFPFGRDAGPEGLVFENTTKHEDYFESRVKRQFFYLAVGLAMQKTSSANPPPGEKAEGGGAQDYDVEFFGDLRPVTSVWVYTRPRKKRANRIIIWPGNPSAELFGEKYPGWERDLKAYELLRAYTVFLGDSEDAFLEVREGDSDEDAALKLLLKLLDTIVDEDLNAEERGEALWEGFGIPKDEEGAIEEVNKVFAMERLYNNEVSEHGKTRTRLTDTEKKLEDTVSKLDSTKSELDSTKSELDSTQKDLKEKNQYIKAINFKFVKKCLEDGDSLETALDEAEIPDEERKAFIREFASEYPDISLGQ